MIRLNKTDIISSSLQVDYYYKNISIQASTSYFTTNGGGGYSESGLNDSFLGASYKLQATESLLLSISVGAMLPTYETYLNNNNTDYITSINASYSFDKVNLFGAYSHSLINDDDIDGVVTYQNINSLSGGIGYCIGSKAYINMAYSLSNSIYSGAEDIQTVSAFGSYSLDENWFSTLSYAYGLSDTASKNHVSIRLGYLF